MKYTILYVEDEEEIRENIKIFLNFQGFDVITANDGRQALLLLETNTPHLILTDLIMPNMDGMQLLHSLSEKSLEVPIIVVTAHGTMESAIQALKAGASDFLTKPIDFEYMIKVIQKVLSRRELEIRVQEQQEQMSRIVNSALDAIISMDSQMNIVIMNPAAESIFQCQANQVAGQRIHQFLRPGCAKKLEGIVSHFDTLALDRNYLWITDGLMAKRLDESEFPAEGTLSRFEMNGKPYYTLILRDINQRLEAEKTINKLLDEAEYLKEEIKDIHNFGEIIGRSQVLLDVLQDVQQVAVTDATVLILGETGTGKELFARAIHQNSRRQKKPFIKVNCAAIPAALIESEFFGHEQGAFTGATKKRDGRFTLADGGTIFLDEIGELPLDLQSKLLRVLQEGEFEPVGSSKTKKVDVRVIAATNRDLSKSVQEGEFREDLYYRLNVFPITLPPLRERGDDVILLATAFAQHFSKKNGLVIQPLTEDCIRCLKAYDWPGNIRELQNVIERAVITARNGKLNFTRALPDVSNSVSKIPSKNDTASESIAESESSQPIRTMEEIQQLERENILRALEATHWRVSGENGAAQLLGMNPSTLSSRMKALQIKRPN